MMKTGKDLTITPYTLVPAEQEQLKTGRMVRERRIKTGMSQRKFADILGISRMHLNRIESDERIPSEELMERMEYFLSCYDPDAEVDIMIDYVRIRFKTIDYKHILEDVLRIRMNYMIRESHAFYGYEAQYIYGNIVLMTSEDVKKGCLLELKGKGCRLFESLLMGQKRTWCDFFRQTQQENCVIKRIDLAVNDRIGLLDISKLTEKLERKEYTSLFHQYDFYKSGSLIGAYEDKNIDAMGSTVYIGSRSSDVYFCVYEKDYEQYIKNGMDMAEAEIRNRFEIRLKEKRAEAAIEDLLIHEDAGATAFGIINRYLTILEPDERVSRRSWQMDKRWARFIGQEERKLRLAVEPKRCDTLEDKLNWITSQCAPTLKAIRLFDASMGEEDRIDKLIDAAHLSPQMEKIIQQAALEVDEIII